MADETETPDEPLGAEGIEAEEVPDLSAERKGTPRLVLYAGVGVIAAAAGYAAATLSGCSGGPDAAEAMPPEAPQAGGRPHAGTPEEDFHYVDFEPLTVNLDEPRLARYISVTLALAIPADQADAETLKLIETKKRVLRDWLTSYFASCSLDDVRGAVNMGRMRREILDAFNQKLWPDQKPRINRVLFMKFTVS
jgi:flagellar basal body-associated protein FliL